MPGSFGSERGAMVGGLLGRAGCSQVLPPDPTARPSLCNVRLTGRPSAGETAPMARRLSPDPLADTVGVALAAVRGKELYAAGRGRDLRQAAGFSQGELGRILGTHVNSVSRWE